jgi:hypothetical protein
MRNCHGVNATVSTRIGHGRNHSGFERRRRNDGQRGVMQSFRHCGPVQRRAIMSSAGPASCSLSGVESAEPQPSNRLDWK